MEQAGMEPRVEARTLKTWVRDVTGGDISTRRARSIARIYGLIYDHGVARVFWKNRFVVAPDVWRSNQPMARDLARMRDLGVRTVINLRGANTRSYRLLEEEACSRLGLSLVYVRLKAKTAPAREALLKLVDTIEKVEAPLLMHCKSGADRTGFAAALWRMLREGDTPEQALCQLSRRFGHSPRKKAGVQGQILRSYAAEGAALGLSFRDWVMTVYDPEAITRAFEDWRRQPA